MLRHHGDSAVRVLVDGVAAFRADVDESSPAQGVYHLAEREIG
jgi:hypothetical protein